MSVIRPDIRTGIRNKLSAWPRVQTVLSGAINATQTTLSLGSLTNLEDRMLFEIDSETLRLYQLANAATNPLTVIRGDRGTTAAAHADQAVVKGYPIWGWTDAMLNAYINRAITWLGEGMVWILVPYTNTWLASNKEFGLPAGVLYPTGDIVKKIDFLDEDGYYKPMLGWQHRGDRIIINRYLDQNTTVKIWVQQRQPVLADDVTAIDQDKAQEPIELYCAGRALEELLANRTRYTEYSATLNDRASSPDELQRVAYYFFNQATILRNEISRPGLSGYAAVQKG